MADHYGGDLYEARRHPKQQVDRHFLEQVFFVKQPLDFSRFRLSENPFGYVRTNRSFFAEDELIDYFKLDNFLSRAYFSGVLKLDS